MTSHTGDKMTPREHLKTCLTFASLKAIAAARERTVSETPKLADGEVSVVVMRTLFTMCGAAKDAE